MRLMILALSLAFSASFAAADISWRADLMAPGSVLVLEEDNQATTHVKRGTEGQQHLFDTYAGQGRDARYIGSYKTNLRGEVTEMIAMDGAVTRFAPHRCTRTLGECRFTVIHADGFQEPRTRVTEATRSGLRYSEYGLDGLLSEGVMELDKIGATKGGWRKGLRDKRKTRTKRVLIALK